MLCLLPPSFLGVCNTGPSVQTPPQALLTGAIPLFSFMNNYKLASSCPAQAVGYQAQGLRADSDSGVTVGDSLVGMGATSALGNQTCETPLPVASQQSASGPNHNLPSFSSPSRAQCPGPTKELGATSNGPGSEAMASPIRLKKHTFRIGTWNMQGRMGTFNSLAKELILINDIDILVLTETHSVDFSISQKSTLLGHTGISTRCAGVAIISSSCSGWYCTDSHTLIDGYAIHLHLHHRHSAESIWVLGIYGNISNADHSLHGFHSDLADALATVTLTIPDWCGCFAAGDWNFMLHSGDRIPASDAHCLSFRSDFNYILDVCSMDNSASPELYPKGWTYHYSSNGSPCYSHLDCIYCPTTSWSLAAPVSIPTLWSDHCLVWADCSALSPKVQMAVPASRLPAPTKLDDLFWSATLKEYTILTNTPVTLPSWTSFKKKTILSLGSQSKAQCKHKISKHWLTALCSDQLSCDELDNTLRDMYSSCSPGPSSPCPQWLPAAPSYAVLTHPPCPSFILTPESPWASTTVVSWHPPHCPPPAPPAVAPAHSPDCIHKLLVSWIKSHCAAALRKVHRMTTRHTSEWYNLSSNKEADEQGSCASIYMVGLHHSPDSPATPVLAEMVQIA